MRGRVNNTTKDKAKVVARAKKKVAKEEKKMSVLQQCLHKIKKVKLDDHNWPNYWVEMRDWLKCDNARNITATRIKSYLNAPIVNKFGALKEEVIKFIVRWYHDRKIWLDQPIAITNKLINLITGVPLNG